MPHIGRLNILQALSTLILFGVGNEKWFRNENAPTRSGATAEK